MWIYTKWHIIWHEFTIHNNKNVCYYGVITAGFVLSERLFVNVHAQKKTFFWFYLSKYNKLEPTDVTKRRLRNTTNISFLCELETVTHFVFMWSPLRRLTSASGIICGHTATWVGTANMSNILYAKKLRDQ